MVKNTFVLICALLLMIPLSFSLAKENDKTQVNAEESAEEQSPNSGDDADHDALRIKKKGNPRVMVVFYSREVDSSFWGFSVAGNLQVENQVENGLLAKGFQLVDAQQVGRKKKLEALLVKGDPGRVNKLAKDFGAEVLVQGEVRRSFTEERLVFGRLTRFFSNEVRLKALETGTGRVLYSGYRTRPPSGLGTTLPIEDATSEMIEEMAAGICEKWREGIYHATSYQLELSNLSFNTLSSFKEGLRNIRGVREAHVRYFQSRHALMEVYYAGSIEELARKISALKNPKPEVTGLQTRTIEISIKN